MLGKGNCRGGDAIVPPVGCGCADGCTSARAALFQAVCDPQGACAVTHRRLDTANPRHRHLLRANGFDDGRPLWLGLG